MILALDLGSKITGWAIGEGAQIVNSGFWNIQPDRFDDYGMRAVRLQNNMTALTLAYPVNECVFERVAFRGKNSSVNEAQLYGLTYGAMALWCKNRSLMFYGVPPGTWKKQLTNNGAASKADIAKAVKRITGKTVEVQDEADAIGILIWRLYNPISY